MAEPGGTAHQSAYAGFSMVTTTVHGSVRGRAGLGDSKGATRSNHANCREGTSR